MNDIRRLKSGYAVTARNVNGMLQEAMWALAINGVPGESRNGPTLVMPGPTLLTYRCPEERVLFNAVRNANPFFHLMESLWMLAGRNDVAFVEQFVKRMTEFSDDGEVLHGAYGFRWRNWFAFDQLDSILEHLIEKPNTRRAVVSMWSPNGDLAASEGVGGIDGKDVPCNTHIYFNIDDGALDMTVCNRSNDLVWGACGANAVHLSVLQEYLASSLGIEVGTYFQFTNNLHLYTERFAIEDLKLRYAADDRYVAQGEERLGTFRLITCARSAWDDDLRKFMSDPLGDTMYEDPFFNGVAAPMYAAWHEHKHSARHYAGVVTANAIAADDWRVACLEWLNRSGDARKAKVTA